MSHRIATLMIRSRDAGGERRFHRAFIAPNGNAKPLYAIVAGKPELRTDGIYYLRYRQQDGIRRYQYVGKDPKLARLIQGQRQYLIDGRRDGPAPRRGPKGACAREGRASANTFCHASNEFPFTASWAGSQRLSLAPTIDKFVVEIAKLRNRKRANQYCLRLGIFLETFEKTYIDEIGDDEVIRFLAELRRRQLCERTIKNYCTDLVAFLRRYELHHRVKKSFIPKPTLKVVRVYPVAVLKTLFAAAGPEDRILFQFFFGLGMREREVMFAAWQDIDFQWGIFHVTEKKADGFTIKDREERSIPIPSSLIEALKQRFEKRTHQRWIFPTDRGQPDGHMLRRLQTVALRAGLSCGDCRTKGGKSCRSTACCRNFGLHKFRRTFATINHENGVSIRTLMEWLGHSDMETTIRYLAIADAGSERVRIQVDRTFNLLDGGHIESQGGEWLPEACQTA
jgi:integrase/recombinase XerD